MPKPSAEKANSHLVRFGDLDYARSAFVDTRTPGSHLKENYCIIGKGVSENPAQPVHIRETRGFHIGAAGQPPGILNSLHSHFSAEIFLIHKGSFRIFWGPAGENETILNPGDLISVPTRCFRGFEVVGEKNGFMFAVLGGDDCGGGIVWHPDVILEGRKHGLYLLKNKTLVDTVKGDPVPAEEDLFPLMSPQEVAELRNPEPVEMEHYISRYSDRTFQKSPFTRTGSFSSSVISNQSEDGVCIYAYRMETGGSVPRHRRVEKQVLIQIEGDARIDFADPEYHSIVLTPGDVYDMPEGAAFSLAGIRGPGWTCSVVGSKEITEPELL
jgi:quercetin dioxygenase-like cupin family protein